MKTKILILFHSGVGNTRYIATKMHEQLSMSHSVDLYSIEAIPKYVDINNYTALIIGFPIYHSHPSKRILAFVRSLERLHNPIPTYLFDTCSMYAANAIRIFSKLCVEKNLIPVLSRDFKGCPATDGTLLVPSIKRFFRFPKNLNSIINRDLNDFCALINKPPFHPNIPRFKLYSIPNYPNKIAGHMIQSKIHLIQNECTRCNKCVRNCPVNAISINQEGYPHIDMKQCESCYRCVHHCPTHSLSLNKKRSHKRLLDQLFYKIT